MTDSPRVLVARFLRANHYTETLEAFLNEAGLDRDAGSLSKDALTIEQVLEEKRSYDVSLNFEKLRIEDEATSWTVPAPDIPNVVDTLPNSSNVLHVSVESLSQNGGESQSTVFATTADRQLHMIQPSSPFAPVVWEHTHNDSPILSCNVIEDRYMIMTTMSGRVALYDWTTQQMLEERRDHKKYVVKSSHYKIDAGYWIATAGWDGRVHIHFMANHHPQLGEPLAVIDCPTNPEAILFVRHPDSALPVLILTRRDSTHLHFYSFPDLKGTDKIPPILTPLLIGRQNLAPHSNAWIAFSPSAIALHPKDPSMIAVATSAMPHMKLLIVRLLLPPSGAGQMNTPVSLTQASQAQAELAVQDREEAAILIHCNTLAPQTPYSTPALAWRPNGSGVWVNGDDGVIRGVETSTGKIIAKLKDGHEAGVKIRCLWSGYDSNQGSDRREIVISGGFDRRLIVWLAEPSEKE